MPLSWNEIKGRAIAFAKEWGEASDERAQSQSFWIEFFAVFGLSSRRVSSFEHAVKKRLTSLLPSAAPARKKHTGRL